MVEVKFRPLEYVSSINTCHRESIADTIFIEQRDYFDQITMVTQRGEFSIPIRALLPRLQVNIPDMFNFGMKPTMEIAETSIEVMNTGNLAVDVDWRVPTPFTIIPRSLNQIEAGESKKFQITFNPTEATVYLSRAVCRVRPSEIQRGSTTNAAAERSRSIEPISQTLKLSGIGKYPYISIPNDRIEFGDILLGRTGEQSITIQNKSLVPATFAIRMINPDLPVETFTFHPKSGVIPPESQAKIRAVYRPLATGSFDSEIFEISTPGGNKLKLSVMGNGVGPQLSIDTKSVNFGFVQMGDERKMLINIHNHSNIEADWAFAVNPNGIFRFEQSNGTLRAKSDASVGVIFRPTAPINFYRRIYLHAFNQNHSLYVDFIGTGYDTTIRPERLSQNHVNVYHNRVQYGLGMIAPEEVEESIKRLGFDTVEVLQREPRLPVPQLMEDYFIYSKPNNINNAVTIDRSYISFGSIYPARLGEFQSVTITNNTEGKITVSSFIPNISLENHLTNSSIANSANDFNDDLHLSSVKRDGCAFFVQPEGDIDIDSKCSRTFKLSFRPHKNNTFYATDIEFVCRFKTMRSFRLVNQWNFTPPWTVTVRALGNTYPDTDAFGLKPIISPDRHIIFPSCLTNGAQYRCVKISNSGDIPMSFDVDLAEQLSVFQCHPAQGVIPPRSFDLIVFRFSPTQEKMYSDNVKIMINQSVSNFMMVTLIGTGYAPELRFENNDRLFFKPTHIAAEHERVMRMQNPSRVATNFEWKVPSKYRDILRVEPSRGTIRAREYLNTRWIFSPLLQEKIAIKIPCFYWPFENSLNQLPADKLSTIPIVRNTDSPAWTGRYAGKKGDSNMRQRMLTVVGEGTTGGISIEPTILDYGAVMVGKKMKFNFTIFNSNSCTIEYRLIIAEKSNNGQLMIAISRRLLCSNEDISGILPERSHKEVTLWYAPRDRSTNEFVVFVTIPQQYRKMIRINGDDGNKADDNSTLDPLLFGNESTVDYELSVLDPITVEHLMCFPSLQVQGEGQYPVIGCVDMRSARQSKSNLWKQFSINDLNKELEKELNPQMTDVQQQRQTSRSTELNNSILTHTSVSQSISFQEHIRKFSRFIFDFGATPIGTEATRVYLHFKNQSDVEAKLGFYFSSDVAADVDTWADDIVPKSEQEKLEQIIMAHELFEISPKSALLKPGETVTVEFSYQHIMKGMHPISALMEIEDGVSVVLDLKGRTIGIDQHYLQFFDLEHCFECVEIGKEDSPIQYYALHNACLDVVEYQVDTAPLMQLQQENYDYKILELENPIGTIEPGSFSILRFRFRPLEAKFYEVELPIHVVGGETYYIIFKGEGIDMRESSERRTNISSAHEFRETNLEAVPSIQTIESIPDQLATLSMEVLDFAAIPCLSINRRMLIIRNMSKKDTVSFEWKSDLPQDNLNRSATLNIEPRDGRLDPGEFSVCRLEFCAGQVQQLIDFDIICLVSNETERSRTEELRKEYEQSLMEDMEEFSSRNRRKVVNAFGLRMPRPMQYFVRIRANVQSLEDFKYHDQTVQQKDDIGDGFEDSNSRWMENYVPILREHSSKMVVSDMEMSNPRKNRKDEEAVVDVTRLDQSLVTSILTDLLQEVVRDSDTARAFFCMEETDCEGNNNVEPPGPRVALYAEFSEIGCHSRPSLPALPILAESDAHPTHDDVKDPGKMRESHVQGVAAAAVIEDDDDNDGIDRSNPDYQRKLEMVREEQSFLDEERGRAQQSRSPSPEDVRQVLQLSDFQNTIEWILSETVFNLQEEAIFGDFDMFADQG